MKRMSSSQKQEIMQMREQGMTYKEIGQHFGITHQATHQSANRIPKQRKIYSVFPNVVKWMETEGIRPRTLADVLNVDRVTVYNWLGAKTLMPLWAALSIAKMAGVSERFVDFFSMDEETDVQGVKKQECGSTAMPNYKEMYYELFNSITSSINTLQEAQRKTEDMYVDAPEPEVVVLYEGGEHQ